MCQSRHPHHQQHVFCSLWSRKVEGRLLGGGRLSLLRRSSTAVGFMFSSGFFFSFLVFQSVQMMVVFSSLDIWIFYRFSLSKLSVCSCWDSDVVRLFGSVSVGDVGTLPLVSVMSRVRLSLVDFSHFVTRNLPTARTVTACLC